MRLLILLIAVCLKTIYAALWNPWEGSSMQVFQRGIGSGGLSFNIQQSNFYQGSYFGYFKFTSIIDPTKSYSLMKLQISAENYTFLHLYIKALVPFIRYTIDDQNYYYDYVPAVPVFYINVWQFIGFGWNQSQKYIYYHYNYSPTGLLYQVAYAPLYPIPSRITQFELCIACQPYDQIFTLFPGQYSTVKMITQPYYVSGIYKFFAFQFNMNAAQLQIYQGTAAMLAYVQGQYATTDLTLACTTTTKVYFDGLCIDNTQCSNIIYSQQTQFGIQNPIYYDSGSNQCLQCPDNCLLCDVTAVCQSCNSGFTLNTGTNSCQRCSSGNFYNPNNQLCVASCPSGYFQDNINQICVQTFNAFYHLLNPILIMSNFNQNDGFALVDSTMAIQSDQYTQCYLDVNSFGFYTILGGQSVLSTYQLHRQILGLPKNYQKTISFQAVIYNNGQQGDFNFQVNNNLITLSSFTKILANQQLCTDNQFVNYYQLNYVINDSTTDLDIYISTNKNGWGIRNFSMNITKCHSTCLDCNNDGNPWSCTSCQMYTSSISVNNNCACNIGQYAQFQNCYSSPCYACASCPPNCVSCEDQTGKCTSCSSGYTIQNGACALSTSCNTYYTNDPASSYCIKAKDYGVSQFVNNKIQSNLDYWSIVGGVGPIPTQCYTMNWAPYLWGSVQTTFTYNLQNYNLYHYQYEINLTVTNIDIFALTDYVAFSINGSFIKNAVYHTDSTTSYCYSAAYGEAIVYEVLTFPTKSNALTFLVQCHFLSASYFTFKDVVINYTRCHASCTNCSDGTSCSSCISNASINASLGNICSCNAGYYFYFDWSTQSGQCRQCNPFCKTCYGPNITDCLTCLESYKVVNSICVNACNTNQLWDFTLHKCLNCSDCCASCTGTANNQCKTCYTSLMTYNSPVCTFNSDGSTCKSCDTNVSNSLCGGTAINNSYCISQGWVVYNPTTCVYCYSADSSGNCGGSSTYNTICNQKGYFYSSTSGSCFYCGKANGTDCGDPTINALCVANKWIYKSLSDCISCMITSDPLCCDNSCKTCNGQYSNNCLSCNGGYILFNGYCLEKCPNGYKLIAASNTCQYCPIFTGVAACNNCNADCDTCAAANTTNCLTCYSSRQLNASTNRCNCNDPEDTRMTFYECSQNNQAVLDIVLSNAGPYMTINFGKLLLDLPGFASQEYSNNVCKALFDATNLQLIGVNALCQVQFDIINITLDQSATIMNGQFLNFLPNVLKFKLNSSVYITTFLNNIAFQQLPQNTAVVFKYTASENTCNDYTIVQTSFVNDSGRGFFSVTWTLLNPTTNADDVKIQSILSLASSAVQGSILIPKGIISVNTQKNIQVQYVLKNTYTGSQQFIFKVSIFKSIVSNFQSNMIIPYYRFQSFAVSLTYIIQYCDATGTPLNTNDPVNISITSPSTSIINTQLTNTNQSEVDFTVDIYTFPSNQNNQINASITLTSDSTVKVTPQISFMTQESPLIMKIVGGNRKIDYQNDATMTYQARDLDVQDSTVNQGITTTWICSDPSNIALPCLDQNNQPFTINSSNPLIPANTFNPYTVIKITLQGTKDVRSYSDQIVVLFIEFDLPVLDVSISLIDPLGKTVNLNEEIFTTLDYSTTVNPDILSFSSTIMYKNTVVSALKFDYTTLKFALWDSYSGFDKAQTAVSIRFSVFNPYYFMPSIQIVYLTINFPPDQCSFTISPTPNAANPVYSLQTVFTLSMQGCVDTNLPLSYQFFMYKSSADLQYELLNPLQAKRRQLSDKSQTSTLLTILPQGNLIIMAAVSDSLQAVYNITLPITVTDSNMSESVYTTFIDSALVTTGKTSSQIISSLSLISEDLSLRTDLASSSPINSRKISIMNSLKSNSQSLALFSTFSTLSDKAISSLMSSGITLSVSDQTAQLTNLQASLAEDWTLTPYQSLTDVQKTIRNQQAFDYFYITDQLMSNSQQGNAGVYNLQVDISTKLGDKMNYNSLPNEEPKIFTGTTLSIQSQQVTEKNLCNYLFCTNYQPPATQTAPSPIFSLAYKTYQNNPYQNDTSFMNYTSSVTTQLNGTNQTLVTNFPVINPSLSTSSTPATTSPINEDDYQLSFQGEKQSGLSCLMKNSNSWTQSGCKLIYSDKSKSYTCFCQSLGPTTIVNDLESLLNNKNIQTAFSSQGLSNLENWTNFYQYIAFWLILGKTIGFVVLYIKGRKLDEQFRSTLGSEDLPLKITKINKIHPTSTFSSYKKKKGQQQFFNSEISQIKKQNSQNRMRKSQLPLSESKQPSTSPFSLKQINENTSSISSKDDKKAQVSQKQKSSSLIKIDDEQQGGQIEQLINQNSKDNQIVSIQLIENEIEDLPNIQNKLSQRTQNDPVIFYVNDIKPVVHPGSLPEIKNTLEVNNSDQTPVTHTLNDDSFNHQSNKNLKKKETILTNPEFSQKSQKFINISKFKQMLYFHNFIGIFLIFDSEMPRALRFSCFYVRLIHSFAISIIFDASYSLVQLIFLSVLNSLVILVFLFIIEKVFKRLKKGFLVLALLGLLGFYYYIILAIVSGQEASKSNMSMLSYLIFTLNDILIVAFVVAALQRYVAIQMIQKNRLQGCQQKFFSLLNLEIIFRSLI